MPRSAVQLVGCSVRLANPDGFFMAGVAEWTIKQVDSSLDALAQKLFECTSMARFFEILPSAPVNRGQFNAQVASHCLLGCGFPGPCPCTVAQIPVESRVNLGQHVVYRIRLTRRSPHGAAAFLVVSWKLILPGQHCTCRPMVADE
jgi:hypothetical protein